MRGIHAVRRKTLIHVYGLRVLNNESDVPEAHKQGLIRPKEGKCDFAPNNVVDSGVDYGHTAKVTALCGLVDFCSCTLYTP
jgi:hypothetical protein